MSMVWPGFGLFVVSFAPVRMADRALPNGRILCSGELGWL
jgi:hypothetical protein